MGLPGQSLRQAYTPGNSLWAQSLKAALRASTLQMCVVNVGRGRDQDYMEAVDGVLRWSRG